MRRNGANAEDDNLTIKKKERRERESNIKETKRKTLREKLETAHMGQLISDDWIQSWILFNPPPFSPFLPHNPSAETIRKVKDKNTMFEGAARQVRGSQRV